MQTFRVRVYFDEFVKFRLPARGCLGIDDATDDDRAFASDDVDLFRGQLVQVCKVDLGNELSNDISE